MKVRLTLKDPDGVDDSITDAVNEIYDKLPEIAKTGNVKEDIRENITDSICKWIEYAEYARIEIDLEAGTATVLEV